MCSTKRRAKAGNATIKRQQSFGECGDEHDAILGPSDSMARRFHVAGPVGARRDRVRAPRDGSPLPCYTVYGAAPRGEPKINMGQRCIEQAAGMASTGGQSDPGLEGLEGRGSHAGSNQLRFADVGRNRQEWREEAKPQSCSAARSICTTRRSLGVPLRR